MKYTCEKKDLLHAVEIAERIVGKKENLPVLSCVLFDVQEKITCTATNLESAVCISIPGAIQKKGKVAVPATLLIGLLRNSRGEKVTISVEDVFTLESVGSVDKIKIVPHDEFPTIPFMNKNEQSYVLPIRTFSNGVTAVLYAASTSLIRPEFASVYITQQNTSMVFAATDSFRLAEKKIQSKETENIFDVLLPTKNAQELISVFSGEEGDAVCVLTESQIQVTVDGLVYVSRVIDGTFPEYTAVIPKNFSTEMTVLKSDFESVLRKGRLFSKTNQYISFHIYPQKKICTITTRNTDIGEMTETLTAALSGDELDINFNIQYLQDCLSTIHSDSVVLRFAGAGKPLVIQGVSDQTFRYLVMPLNK